MNSPQHVAIIMDGNGRWAQLRGRQRIMGHMKGARVAKQIISECARLKIQNLTLYAFSTENWFRPQEEVLFLMSLLKRYLEKERKSLIEQNIRFSVIGDMDRLPPTVQEEVTKSVEQTKNNTGLHLTFALSYGSRSEMLQATQKIAQQVKDGLIDPKEISEELFANSLSTKNMPDPDLIIRTSGECRLSNFMLWQSAYSELYFTETLWPDFSKDSLHEAFSWFAQRDRRFGRIKNSNPVRAQHP